MIKTIGLLDKLAPTKNDSNKSVFSKNNDRRQVFERSYGNVEVDRFISNNMEYIKKSKKLKKLSKSRNSKSKKLFKYQKLAKSRKKLSKSRNLPNFDVKDNEPSFLTLAARAAFNYLWLTFIEALILGYFDPKYYIWIQNNVSSYAISIMLSLLASGTKLDRVVIKTNLSQWHLIVFFSKKIIFAKT